MATVAVHYVLVALSFGFAVILTLNYFILLPSLFWGPQMECARCFLLFCLLDQHLYIPWSILISAGAVPLHRSMEKGNSFRSIMGQKHSNSALQRLALGRTGLTGAWGGSEGTYFRSYFITFPGRASVILSCPHPS